MHYKTIGLLVAAAALVAAACAAPAPAPAPSEAPEPVSTGKFVSSLEEKLSLSCEAGKEHWSDAGSPKRGGVLKVAGSTGRFRHLDRSVGGGASLAHSPQVYGHLVKSRGCYYEDTVIQPDVAESWELSADGLTWTFNLRKDVRWHNKPPVNGRPFTSADVAYTIEHAKAGGLMRAYFAPVTYETPDDHTIVMRLSSPDADFLAKMEERSNVLLPKEVKDEYGDYKTVAIGTGPFMQESYDKTRAVTVPNPDYPFAMGADGKPLPYIEKIETILFADKPAEIAAFRSGQLDQNGLQSFNKLDTDATVQALPKTKRYTDFVGAIWGVFFNFESKPWDDPQLRKAVALAVNPGDMIELYKGGAVYTSHLPSALLQWAWSPDKAKDKMAHDLEGAKRLLKEAGYGPGELSFTLKTSPTEIPQGELIQKQLEAAGMNVKLVVTDVHTSTVMQKHDFDIAWGAVSPASFMVDRHLSSGLSCKGQYNVDNYCDPKMDKLAESQLRELDAAKRKQIIDEMQDYIYEVMPYVPTVVINYHRLYSCQLKNMRPDHMTPDLKGVEAAWLDDSGC